MILGIIPAKGNSEGLKQKNLKPLMEEPLVHWTIKAALRSQIDDIIVVTDNEQIGSLARAIDPEVHVFDEPKWLTGSEVQVDTIVYYTWLQAKSVAGVQARGGYDSVVVLQPTSPFRTEDHIDEAIELFSVVKEGSLMGMGSSRKFLYIPNEDGTAHPIWHDPVNRLGRQDYDTDDMVLYENGSIYIVDTTDLMVKKNMRVLPITPYIMGDVSSVEIDTEIDFILAERILQQYGYGESTKKVGHYDRDSG